MIRGARPERLRELLLALEELDAGPVRASERAEDLRECDEGQLILLALREADLDWLNFNRPLFVQRRLRAVLWVEDELADRLKFLAPDLHDWISHFVKCPPGVPEHARAGLSMGLRWWPGLAWRGGDFAATWVASQEGASPPVRSAKIDYGDLVALLEDSSDVPVRAWTDVDTLHALTRLRWALAESGYSGRNVLLDPGISTPGWFPVDGHCTTLVEAARRLREAGVPDPVRACAWVNLEPEAIETLARWGKQP
ncbi:MAG: hypothetical protein KC457_33055, partial [Myxococcales bacterium]|nr:hypothetical protein [Myxococcales bacterium]